MHSQHFRPLANSLIRKIIALIAACTLLMVGLQGTMIYRQEQAFFNASLRDIANSSVPLLATSLWDIEPENIQQQLALIADRHQIGYVRLVVKTGQIFEAGQHALEKNTDQQHFDIPHPHGNRGLIGHLDVWPDHEAQYTDMLASLLPLLAGYGILGGLVCLLIALILRRDLQHPMQQIAAFVTELRPDKLSQPLQLDRPVAHTRDEIDLVTEGFAALQRSLNNHITHLDQRVADRTHELKLAMDAIHQLSITDPLTGCFNRHHFEEHFVEDALACVAERRAFSVVFCDIDHFKNINDTLGHIGGDQVLAQLGERLRTTLRAGQDWVVRYGGEEFVIVLRDTPLKSALSMTERLRQYVCATPLEVSGQPMTATASFGVAQLREGEHPNDLLERVDALLYQAKQEGRNRVCPSDDSQG